MPPVAVPENASLINSVAFFNVSSNPSAPPAAPAPAPAPAVPASAPPNIDPISPITSSSLVFSSLSSIASNNFAVSPNEPISERLFTIEKRTSWRYFQMMSLVLSAISSVAQISRKSMPGSMLTMLASLACALSAPVAPFVALALLAPLSLLASLTVLSPSRGVTFA